MIFYAPSVEYDATYVIFATDEAGSAFLREREEVPRVGGPTSTSYYVGSKIARALTFPAAKALGLQVKKF